ncbi:MAG: HAD-IA family hydrolase [Planctomycetota bacterium]
MKPGAIFLDIDNTLFPTRDFASQARLNGLKSMMDVGLRGQLDDLMRQLSEVVREFGSNDSEHFRKLLMRLAPESLDGHNPGVLEAAGIVGYSQTKFRLYKAHEDVISVLRELHAMEMPMGIISNGRTLKQAEKLVRLGVLPFLRRDAILISEQIGIAKPNPEIFLRACLQLGVEPGQAWMVGDSLETDILPSRALGMTAVQNCRGLEPGERVPEAHHHIQNFWDLLDLVKR